MSASLDRERLVAVLGMLGSAHDGEILAAARQAERIRRAAGVTWKDVILPALTGPTRHREIESFEDAISFALDSEAELTRWEMGFLTSLRRQRTPVSPKQRTILIQIITKILAAKERAAS